MRVDRLHRLEHRRLHRRARLRDPARNQHQLRRVWRPSLHAGEHAAHLQRWRRLHRGRVRAGIRQLRCRQRRLRDLVHIASSGHPAFPSMSARSRSPRRRVGFVTVGDRARRILLRGQRLRRLGRLRPLRPARTFERRRCPATASSPSSTPTAATPGPGWWSDAMSRSSVLAATPNGGVVATGAYSDTIDLDPGASADIHFTVDPVADRSIRRGAGRQRNICLGEDLRGQRLGSYGTSRGVAVDGAGAVYVTGSFVGHDGLRSRHRTDRRTRHRAAENSSFLVKLTAAGNLGWAQTYDNGSCAVNLAAVAVASDGAVWATGLVQAGDSCTLDTARRRRRQLTSSSSSSAPRATRAAPGSSAPTRKRPVPRSPPAQTARCTSAARRTASSTTIPERALPRAGSPAVGASCSSSTPTAVSSGRAC